MVRADGLASASETPAVKESAEPQQCGASSTWWLSASAAILRASDGPPQIVNVWLDDVDESPVDEVGEVEPGELALAGGDRDAGGGADAGGTGAIVGSDRLLEPSDPARLDRGGERDPLSGGENVPCASTIRSIAGPSPARAAWTWVMLAATSPSITPTRIFTAPKPCSAYARSWAPISSAPAQPPDVYAGQRVVACPSPECEHRHADRPPNDVPQGHVDGADGADGQPSAPECGHHPAGARGVHVGVFRCTSTPTAR